MLTHRVGNPFRESLARREPSARIKEPEVFTVRYQGWSGLKNGELLRTAENDGFEVFVTGDQTLSYEQNLTSRQIAVVALSAIEWHIIRHSLLTIQAAIDAAAPGSRQAIECGVFSRKLTRP